MAAAARTAREALCGGRSGQAVEDLVALFEFGVELLRLCARDWHAGPSAVWQFAGAYKIYNGFVVASQPLDRFKKLRNQREELKL